MSRFSKLGSVGVVCSVVTALSLAALPSTAWAKGPSGGMNVGNSSQGSANVQVSKSIGGSQFSKNMGNQPLVKNVGDPSAKKIGKIGSDPISKTPAMLPVGKIGKIGSDPISKTPKKIPLLNPIDPAFSHHDFFCNPHHHWLFFPLIVETVTVDRVYGEPLYTLYYETSDGVKVFSRYELPSESATLYKTEHALDKSNTAWWLVSTTGELVDTNTADKAATVQATAAAE